MQPHRFVTAMAGLFKLHLASGVCMQAGLPDPRVAASVVSAYAKDQGANLSGQRIGEAFVSAALLMRFDYWACMLTRDTKRQAYYYIRSYCLYGGRESFYKHRQI